MLNTVRRFIYTKYWEILDVKHCWKIHLHKILGNTLCWILLEDSFTQNTGNTLCWTLWEDLFTQNTGGAIPNDENCGKSWLYRLHEDAYTKYWGISDDENWEGLITQNTRNTLFCSLWELISKYFGEYNT